VAEDLPPELAAVIGEEGRGRVAETFLVILMYSLLLKRRPASS
jgi:hypothetical protein